MLTAEQELQISQILDAITYIMENHIRGNLILAFSGNGYVGGQGKFENFFSIGKSSTCLRDMERLSSIEKNINNKEAAKKLGVS